MSCKNTCKNYKPKITGSRGTSLYQDNFFCRTCKTFVNPCGIIKQNSKIMCSCCGVRVRSKPNRNRAAKMLDKYSKIPLIINA